MDPENTPPAQTNTNPPQQPIISTQTTTPATMQPTAQSISQTSAQNVPPTPLTQEKSGSAWAVIGLLITFPPAAWTLMWKNKRFHSWFHKILLIYGILGLLGVVDFYYSIPEIIRSYKSLGLSAPSNLTFINELNLIFSVLQILYAVYMWYKIRNSKDINIFDVIVSGAIIFVPFLIILYMMMITFLKPIYNISNQLGQY